MDLAFTPEEQKFAAEVRAFVKANLPADVRDKVKNGKHLGRDDYMRWQQALGKKGWLVYTWPKKHGGPGFTPAQRYIFENICAEEYAPGIIPFGTKMVGPVIYTFGSDEQKAKYLPAIRESTVWWCQGYSEPGSGSDLASLRTKAEKQGDHYIVNGSKTWNTMGHWADWIFCLVRTDPKAKPQEGISFLLIDMTSPGIRIDPIYLVDGTRTPMRHEVNQVFFTDVKVPVENRVGEENMGWTYAKYLLEFERGGQAFGPRLRKAFRHLKELAHTQLDGGEPLSLDPKWREKVAALEMEIDAVEMNELMFYSSMKSGQNPGTQASIVKMRGTEVGQKVTELAVEAVGWYGAPFTELRNYDSNVVPVGGEYVDDVAPRYFNQRKTTIYGGSSEVQRNVLAKAMLGL